MAGAAAEGASPSGGDDADDALDVEGPEQDERPPGLGAEDFPGFPTEVCPDQLPDLQKHFSTLADVLKGDPTIYQRIRGRRTSLSVGLGRCIKVGIDNRGHQLVRTMGLVAGDEECYVIFRELFDAVMQKHLERPLGRPLDGRHPMDMGRQGRGITTVRLDPTGRYVTSALVRASRSLSGFRFPPAMTLEERTEVEHRVARALCSFQGTLKGEYYPLQGSQTYAPRPNGMCQKDEETLRAAGLLFEAPDSTMRLCTGAGRHWPEGRGVFVNASRSFTVWVNEQEHLRLVAVRQGDALPSAFAELVSALDLLDASLSTCAARPGLLDRGAGHDDRGSAYARSDRLGFLTSNPANIGTAMHVSLMVNLPLLAAQDLLPNAPRIPPWRAWCQRQRAQVRRACSETGSQVRGLFEVSNIDRLGCSEVDVVNLVAEATARIVQMEQRLEADQPFDDLMVDDTPACVRVACGGSDSQEAVEKARNALALGLLNGRLLSVTGSGGAPGSAPEEGALWEDRSPEVDCAQAFVDSMVQSVVQGPLARELALEGFGEDARSITPPGSEAQVSEKPWPLKPSVGTWLGASPKFTNGRKVPEGPWQLKPSVCTWFGALPKRINGRKARGSVALDSILERSADRSRLSINAGQLSQAQPVLKVAHNAATEAVASAVRKSLTTEVGLQAVRDKARDALMQAGLDGTLREALTRVHAGGDSEKKKEAGDSKVDDSKAAPAPADNESEKGEKLTELFFAHPFPAVSEHDSYKSELLKGLTGIGMKDEHAKRLRVDLREGSTIAEIFGPSKLKADMQVLPLRNMKMRGFGAMLSKKELEEHANCEKSETELRDATRSVLEAAFRSGQLEGALKGLQTNKTQAPVSDKKLEDLRLEAQQALLAAAKDGILANTLGAAQKANPKAAVTGKVEGLNSNVLGDIRRVIKEALDDGSFEKALQEATVAAAVPKGGAAAAGGKEAASETEVEALRTYARQVLVEASLNGTLEDELAVTRSQMRNVLSQAAADGSLGRALALEKDQPREAVRVAEAPPPEPKIEVQYIRENARKLLTQAAADGNLARVFEDLRAQQSSEPEVEDVREKLFGMLESACDSGALEEALKDLSGTKAEALNQAKLRAQESINNTLLDDLDEGDEDPEGLCPRAFEALVAANDSGALQDAMRRLSSQSAATSPPSKDISRMFMSALEDGSLEKALQTVAQDPEGLCPRALEALVAANDSGALQAAMHRLSSQSAATPPPSKEPAHTPQAPSKPHTGRPRPGGRAPKAESGSPAGGGALWVLGEVRKRDGRVGELVSMIRETERQIEDRERRCTWLEERLDSTRVDAAHIVLDLEWHKRALESAVDRGSELEATQRKLAGELEGQQMKLRSTEGTLSSARSNTSTEASGFGATMSSIGTSMSWSCMPPSPRLLHGTLEPLPLGR